MKVSNVPFQGTAEQEAKLIELIEKYKGQKGCLMPILQGAQNIYGYLPYEVQKIISDNTGIPRPNISRLESGKYNPTLDMIVRVADSIGLEVEITLKEKKNQLK